MSTGSVVFSRATVVVRAAAAATAAAAQSLRVSRTQGRHRHLSFAATSFSSTAKMPVIFFDCDDTLYKNDWKVANALTARIDDYCSNRLGLPSGYAYDMYKKYGTALRGLQEEKLLDASAVEDFLYYCHDLPLHEHIGPDLDLQSMLTQLVVPKWVFTASARHHAAKCLELLGVHNHFIDIIDVRSVSFHTKHNPAAYLEAMRIAGVSDPNECVFLDDSTSNMKAAKSVGWRTVLVGRYHRDTGHLIDCEHADHVLDTVHELQKIMPELFVVDVEDATVGIEQAVPTTDCC